MDIGMRRAYDEAGPDDGLRILVDRLWPRGVSKERARIDRWEKAVAPSPDLRRSWHADPHGHDPDRFAAFADAYRAELRRPPASDALDELAELARSHGRVTLVYGARDPEINHVVVLREALLGRLGDA